MKSFVALFLFSLSIIFVFFITGADFSKPKVSEAAVCTTINRPLFFGLSDPLTGGQVTELQNFLKSQGYFSEAITGFFGESTEAAVKKFQRRYTIALFGEVYNIGFGATGPLTRAKIKSVSCYVPPPPRPAAVVPATTPPPVAIPVVPPPVEPPVAPPTAGPLSVTCRPSPSGTTIGDSINWRSTIVSSPNTTHTYNWQGTDGLTGTNSSAPKTYSTVGTKSASVTVDGQTFTCTPNLTVSLVPPPTVSWPLASLSPEPLFATTDSFNGGGQQNYAYLTQRYGILFSPFATNQSSEVARSMSDMGKMLEGRRVFYSLTSYPDHAAIAGDSLDNCKSVVDGIETLTSFPCPWWDNGVDKTKTAFTDFASAFKTAGGVMDFIILDTERHFVNWTIQSVEHADAIQNDPRFADLLTELQSSLSFYVVPPPAEFHFFESIISGNN
ncbi:MAG: peptidoglycan-binding domain-containing protein, partial [Patescibacteria group bacterium]